MHTTMATTMPTCASHKSEAGVALLTALLLMLAILLTGIASARSALHGALAAGNERDRMLAMHGAMAALADAEGDIEGGADPASARAAALAGASPSAFSDGCRGGAPYQGLCSHAPAGDGAIHEALADGGGPGVTLGAFTAAQIPTGAGALAAQPPRYLIERMPSPPEALLYRITALGFGSAGTTQVAVQAYYRKLLAAAPSGPSSPGTPGEPPPAGDPGSQGELPAPSPAPDSPGTDTAPAAPGTPGGAGVRVSWREIANWHDGVAAAAAPAGTEEG